MHLYHYLGLPVLDEQLVHDDPGKDEEDAGQYRDQREDGAGHISLLEQEEEIDNKVETWTLFIISCGSI